MTIQEKEERKQIENQIYALVTAKMLNGQRQIKCSWISTKGGKKEIKECGRSVDTIMFYIDYYVDNFRVLDSYKMA